MPLRLRAMRALAAVWLAGCVSVQVTSSSDIAIPMTRLPGGTFTMGNTGAAEGEPIERPTHEVTVAPFEIGTYEVTQAEYEAVMGHNPSQSQTPDQPVEWVSWYDAVRFCNVLSEREGLTPAYRIDPFEGYTLDPEADGYRLPTEPEWEYAAKAGTSTDTYGGDVTVDEGVDPALDPIGWVLDAEPWEDPKPVGQKAPNDFGLYDTIGNVFEWTDAAFMAYPGGDVSGVPGGSVGASLKVLRGGAIDTAPAFSRASYRYRLHPSYTSHNVGFRIARSL